MKKIALLFFVLVAAVCCRSADVARKDVDTARYSTIVIKDFSLDGAAIQENDDVKAFAQGLPKQFSEYVKSDMESLKTAENVVLGSNEGNISGDYVVIEGNFTKVTAGSTAARILVGFGAGSSTVGAKWEVKDGKTGKVLGSFEKNRHTASGFRGAQAVNADAQYLAKDVAKLLHKLLR